MKTVYHVIQPPFTLKFREMSRKELKDYYEWYMEQIPVRIDILANAVKSTPGFEDWKADYSSGSLVKLGEWFVGQVETRDMSETEIDQLYADSTAWFRQIEIEKWELTNRTSSVAIDVGMYLSQVFLKTIDRLEWKHVIKGSKSYIDYGQPVITGFGEDEFNPVHMIITLAYGIADNSKTGTDLKNIYDIWKSFA